MVSVAAIAARTEAAAPTSTRPTTPQVQELVVTGQRAQTETLIDRKVYTVTSDLQATTGVAADVLNNVPSVVVDTDGNLTLRGDGNVTILVDGKPSAQFSGAGRGLALQQFPASDIDRIEVLANPPAQYKAEGSGGVINIVTKKTRKPGFSGNGQVSVGDQRRYVLALDGAYNLDRLKVTGGIGLRQDARERTTLSDRTAIDPSLGDLVQSTQTIDEHFLRLTPSIRAGLDYTLNDRQILGGSFSDRDLTGNRYFDQRDASGPPAVSPSAISTRHSDGHEWNVERAQGLHFDQKLWRAGETFTLAIQRSAEHERERYAYRNTFTLPATGSTFDDLNHSHDLVKTDVSIDYDLPLTHGREFRLGYDLEADRNAFDDVSAPRDPLTGLPISNPANTNHFRYRQDVNAAYGQYQTPLGPWGLQAGLRLEAADSSGLQLTGNIPYGHHEFGAYPSLHIERSLGEDAKLSVGVARRVTRPNPEALNPFADVQDTHNLRAGNPDLLPKDTWSYEAGYTSGLAGLSYGATAYYRFDRNSITDVVRPLSGDVVLTTKANLPKSRSAGLEFSASGKLGDSLSYRLSGDAFYSQIDALPLGVSSLRSTTGVNLKANLDYRPTPVDTAQISLTRTDRRLTPQGSLSAVNIVNIGYRRQLQPDLAIVLTLADALNGQRQERIVTTPVLRDDYVRRQSGRIGYVGLVYTFGTQKKAKAPGFEYDP